MIYISLGSNLGDRINNLRVAAYLLTKKYLRNVRVSMVIETEAILPDNARSGWDKPFLNMIIEGNTDLSPKELLATIKSIEFEMGRPAFSQKWHPRIIDLDILLWDEHEINTHDLIIPHPEINNRPFLQHLLAVMGVQPWHMVPITNSFSKALVLYPAFVGVVNITSDSFSDGGLFNQPDKAIEQIYKLVSDGASILFVNEGLQR
ncbi:MAG: 2-amino-4-hydroxy-6-hydroxymethyldihydropteridine diphosphokinase [Rickettsia endosymbiont of Bryobia graminum]|nr:2-amino-4-hydroxy-6-hydroxymethyldihydropteridine diphosphokinase [Rickettsia endosymbiont of Bryobia graminum]